jgi:ELWxxDGT repeat protein
MTTPHTTDLLPVAVFAGTNADNIRGLWITDGTATGTQEITGISGLLDPYELTAFNGGALFGGIDASDQQGLWITNGTASGTHEITGIVGAGSGGIVPHDLTVFYGDVLFAGYDAVNNVGLWVTNGTTTGTYEITINGAYAAHNSLRPFVAGFRRHSGTTQAFQ